MLKVQLKKYVGAVQMLKREGQTAEGEGQRDRVGRGLYLFVLITPVPGPADTQHEMNTPADELEKWCCLGFRKIN